jgi:hypothetical protein
MTVTELGEAAEWQWADPIADCFKVDVQQDSDMTRIRLGCERCGQSLYTVGQIDLWELAVDAKRHALYDCEPASTANLPKRQAED